MAIRTMPIQRSLDDLQAAARGERRIRVTSLPGPMFGEAEERRSREWHGQSLRTIADRCGFGAVEAACVLTGIPFDQAPWSVDHAHRTLAAMQAAFERGRRVVIDGRAKMEATPMTPRILAYAQAAFREDLAQRLGLAGPGGTDDPVEELRALASQLGLDFEAERAMVEAPSEPAP